MLRFQQFEKNYHELPVLSIEELVLPEAIYWIKGPNGAGKSTLMKAVAGMIPFRGEVWLDEKYSLHRNRQAYKQKVSYAEAEPVFPDFLTGEELINYCRQLLKADKAQVKKLSERMGVDRFADQKTGTYSSGMLKKLTLLMAFIGGPRLILLDEPFTTLDQKTQEILKTLITEYAAKGTGFLLTSHQPLALPGNSQPVALQLENKTLQPSGKDEARV